MKRRGKLILLVLCAAAVATGAYAAGGQDDPLVTLSYLKNVFTGQVEAMVDQKLEDSGAQVKSELEQSIADWDSKVSQAIDEAETGSGEQGRALFQGVSLERGRKLKCPAGTELILRSGAAAADTALLDQTDGTVLEKGQSLKTNHLYYAESACTLTVSENKLTGTVNAGPLNVRSGAGSSYKILGQLSSGTAVTILSTTGSWYQVSGGGLTGYVSAVYITLNPASSAGGTQFLARGSYAVE